MKTLGQNYYLSSLVAAQDNHQFYRYQVFKVRKLDIGVLLASESLEEHLSGRICPV